MPAGYPFGPYANSFPATQHRFRPFQPFAFPLITQKSADPVAGAFLRYHPTPANWLGIGQR
jgi:hypothetical protein